MPLSSFLGTVVGALDVLGSGWRFALVTMVGLVVTRLLYFGFAQPGDSLVPAALLAVVAMAAGFAWEYRSHRQ